jgi:hypothetical protein
VSAVPYIDSAYLCITQCKRDCDSAIESGWGIAEWDECLRNLNEAKWQLESAISKVQRYKEEAERRDS